MDDQAGRFVDRDQVIIFENHRQGSGRRPPLPPGPSPGKAIATRSPNAVARLETRRIDTPLIVTRPSLDPGLHARARGASTSVR